MVLIGMEKHAQTSMSVKIQLYVVKMWIASILSVVTDVLNGAGTLVSAQSPVEAESNHVPIYVLLGPGASKDVIQVIR